MPGTAAQASVYVSEVLGDSTMRNDPPKLSTRAAKQQSASLQYGKPFSGSISSLAGPQVPLINMLAAALRVEKEEDWLYLPPCAEAAQCKASAKDPEIGWRPSCPRKS